MVDADSLIKAHKQAELSQDGLPERLNNTNEDLERFISIILHDLEGPLRGIEALANWILSDCADKPGDQADRQMNLLLKRVERIGNLMEGALRYLKVGPEDGKRKKVYLNDFVPEIVDAVVPRENIAVTIENELPVLECEEVHIRQIFQNLLSNAIKFIDKPQGWIRIGCVEQDGFWKFSVADSGPGSEKKHFERVLAIFQTLSSSLYFAGSGKGLAVVKEIIEAYGGKIWVESKGGEGSSFIFTMPRRAVCESL